MDVTKKMYCSKSQKEMLIELLQKDPQLISGKFTKHFTYKEARKRWTTISDTLNALPGCSKDWSQWKRVSNNKKFNLQLYHIEHTYYIIYVYSVIKNLCYRKSGHYKLFL